MWKKILQLKR